MKLCIPTDDDRGLDSPLSAHFGRAAWYTVVDIEGGAVHAMRNAHDEGDHHGPCNPMAAVSLTGADAVLCLGLGKRALAGLAAAGIRVYLTDEPVAARAVEAFRSGRLEEASLRLACGGGQNPDCHDHA